MALNEDTLRPDTVISDTGLTLVTGAADAAAAWSDESGASYVSMEGTGLVRVRLDDIAMPAGARTGYIAAFMSAVSSTGTGLINLSLHYGSTVVLGAARVWNQINLYALGGTQFATSSQNWSDEAVDAMYARVEAIDAGGGDVDLDELWVVVGYWDQPTVTVTNPTGTISTTSYPEVVWTSTDLSSFGLQRFRVKIFDDATYGAGGFDPDTSPAVYDSGEQVGPGQEGAPGWQHTPTGPLPNGDTYKAYVKVAQQVNGSYHWSEWDDGPAFLMDLTQPAVPTITVTEDPATASALIELDRTDASDWEFVEIQRYNPTTGEIEFVRGASYVPAQAVDEHDVIDYEPPTQEAGWVYRARVEVTVSAELVSSEWVQSAEVLVDIDGVWIKDPTDPTLNALFKLTNDLPSRGSDPRHVIIPVLGRSDPIMVSDVRLLGTGSLQLVLTSLDQQEALDALLDTGRVLYLDSPGMWDLHGYIAPGSAGYSRGGPTIVNGEACDPRTNRIVGLSYTFVGRPYDDASVVLNL